ncbi:MAG: hypothetical protein QXE57_05065 [Nitrososphaerales archaeon]
MKTPILALLTLIFFSALAVEPSLAQNQTATTVVTTVTTVKNVTVSAQLFETRIVAPAYVPAKLAVQFARSSAIKLSNITSVGQSNYVITQTPDSFTFKTEDTDVFQFWIQIAYPQPVDQTVVIGVWSEEQLTQTYYRVSGNLLKLNFELRTSKAPKYPTPEQVATAVIGLLKEQLKGYTDAIVQSNIITDRNLNTQWILVGFGVLASFLSLIAISAVIWRQRRIG